MESLADRIPAFVFLSCFAALGLNDTVTKVSLTDLLRFALNTLDGKEHCRAARPVRYGMQ